MKKVTIFTTLNLFEEIGNFIDRFNEKKELRNRLEYKYGVTETNKKVNIRFHLYQENYTAMSVEYQQRITIWKDSINNTNLYKLDLHYDTNQYKTPKQFLQGLLKGTPLESDINTPTTIYDLLKGYISFQLVRAKQKREQATISYFDFIEKFNSDEDDPNMYVAFNVRARLLNVPTMNSFGYFKPSFILDNHKCEVPFDYYSIIFILQPFKIKKQYSNTLDDNKLHNYVKNIIKQSIKDDEICETHDIPSFNKRMFERKSLLHKSQLEYKVVFLK